MSGSGRVDLRLPVFTSGKVSALIIATRAGGKRLREQSGSASVDIRAVRGSATAISASAILAEVIRVRPGKRILVEGGPRLLATSTRNNSSTSSS